MDSARQRRIVSLVIIIIIIVVVAKACNITFDTIFQGGSSSPSPGTY